MRPSVRRWLVVVACVALVASVLAPFVHPPLGLELWRTATRLRHGVTSGTVEVNGVPVAWSSKGEGPTVLLVHGLRAEIPVMLPLASELAERGFRAVAIDLPGHGRSGEPDEPLDVGSAARTVLDTARALELPERTVVVGHSLGGWIVAWAALESPQAVSRAVLIAPAGLAFEPPPLDQLMPPTASDAARSLPRLFADPPWVPLPFLRVAVGRRTEASAALLGSALSGAYLLDGLLEGADVPMLVLAGEQDGIVPPDVGRRMAEASPAIEFESVGDAAHMIVWEESAWVADRIAAFARR